MFTNVWNIFCRVLLIAGVLITFIILVELFRIFMLFNRISPVLAWAYVIVIVCFLIMGIFYSLRRMILYPRAITPPPLPDDDEATYHEMRRYCKYLIRYLDRLSKNPGLHDHERASALNQINNIEGILKAHPLKDDLQRAIQNTEAEIIHPIINTLDELAEREVRRSVRDVMLGVTLSPYHSIDIFIVLYRNTAMIRRIMAIYYTRPPAREEYRTLRDVLKVVATVNFLYIGRNLVENLFAFVPVIGRIADDIGQGLGAGLFTSAAGHAAMHRSAAFRGWNKQEASETLSKNMTVFARDVKNIFTRDVLPDIKGRIMAEAPPDEARQAGFINNISLGIGKALDSTVKAAGNFIVKPAVAGAQGAVDSGTQWIRPRRNGKP